jgi:hypothetical protein
MSPMAALRQFVEEADDEPVPGQAFLPLQLASVAEATGGLISSGLACRTGDRGPLSSPLTDDTGALRREIAPLALAYEAALLSSLTPQEVAMLRRLLARVEAAALKLSGRV